MADRRDQKRDRLVETVGSGSIPASVSMLASIVPPLLAKIAQEGLSRRGARTGIQLKAAPLKITPAHYVLLALSSRANGLLTSFIITEGP